MSTQPDQVPARDTSAAAAALAHQYSCDSPAKPVRPMPDGRVPMGAVSARICPTADVIQDWVSPPETLTYGVDTLAAQVNGLPFDPGNETCSFVGSIFNFRITFQYPDAQPVQVVADLGGCGTLRVRGQTAAAYRSGPDLVLTTYLREMLQQRQLHPAPPPEPPNARCALPGRAPPSPLPETVPLRLVSARLCAFEGAGNLVREVDLTRAQLARVSRDYTAHAVSRAPRHSVLELGSPGDSLMVWFLVGQSRWGDRVVMFTSAGYFYRWAAFLDKRPYWVPSPPIRSLLTRVTAS